MEMMQSNQRQQQRRPPPLKDLKRDQQIVNQLEGLIEKPSHRICRLPAASPSSEDTEVKELYGSLPRFGPFYNRDEPLMKSLKKASWQHVVSRSPTPESKTIKIYMAAMKKINAQARFSYEEGAVEDHLSDSLFSWMMVEDGCFILQLALFVLGGSAQLNYPPDHIVFGEKRNTDVTLRKWTRSMFFVGNQVPQVVLMELMKQTFFQEVLSSGSWKRPSDLSRQTLYDSLLLPFLATRHLKVICRIFGIEREDHLLLKQQPSDLLHGLHLLFIGQGNGAVIEDENENGEEFDLEADGEDFGGNVPIRSATELKQSGIEFRKIGKGNGIRGLKFRTNIFHAVLELPTLVFDENTERMFKYLIDYEITQQLSKNKREVGSFLQLMSELIRTPDDAKILFTSGIIQANRNQRQKLPKILKSLANEVTTQNTRIIRLQIEDYSRPPWEKFRNYLSVVLLLTLVQTVYTVLSYYK